MKKWLCIFGHNFECSQYLHPMFWPSGMMSYWGMYSKCTRCGKEVDSEKMNLPILEPEVPIIKGGYQ